MLLKEYAWDKDVQAKADFIYDPDDKNAVCKLHDEHSATETTESSGEESTEPTESTEQTEPTEPPTTTEPPTDPELFLPPDESEWFERRKIFTA